MALVCVPGAAAIAATVRFVKGEGKGIEGWGDFLSLSLSMEVGSIL